MSEKKEIVIAKDKMEIEEIEKELYFNCGVSRTIEFVTKRVKGCIICDNKELSDYIAPFISSSASKDKIRKLIYYKFGITVLDEDINEHRPHITCEYYTDDELKTIAVEDLKMLESEIIGDINEDVIIESQIRQLTALAHLARKDGDSKMYMDCSDKLYKWVILKKKLKQEMPQNTTNVMFGDVIKMEDDSKPEIGLNDKNRISTTTRTTTDA